MGRVNILERNVDGKTRVAESCVKLLGSVVAAYITYCTVLYCTVIIAYLYLAWIRRTGFIVRQNRSARCWMLNA